MIDDIPAPCKRSETDRERFRRITEREEARGAEVARLTSPR
jgi:hypothetical protein